MQSVSKESQHGFEHYDRFYSGKGWQCTVDLAKREIGTIATSLGWRDGAAILDLGSGQGQHTEALRQLGFRPLGLDSSEVGIGRAKRDFPNAEYVCANAACWEPGQQFDAIYCRAMSWYHYELHGVNRHGVDVPHETRRFCTWVKSGGHFVLRITTDLSGTFNDKEGVLNNTLSAYTDLFGASGKIVLLTDWHGKPLDADARTQIGIVIAIEV